MVTMEAAPNDRADGVPSAVPLSKNVTVPEGVLTEELTVADNVKLVVVYPLAGDGATASVGVALATANVAGFEVTVAVALPVGVNAAVME